MSIGSELKRIREENDGISVQKIADKVGVDAGRWRKWESKDLNPKDDDRVKIERFFGVAIYELHKIHKVKFSSKNVLKEEQAPYYVYLKIKPNYVQRFTSLH